MSSSVLDSDAAQPSKVDEEQLPCRRKDPDLFFAETPRNVEAAKMLCQNCPVRAECLAGALHRREPRRVWGGQLLLQGTVVPRERPRGRPRKNVVLATSAAAILSPKPPECRRPPGSGVATTAAGRPVNR
jgi:WhiB family redox-sensing transcriptional regulator